MADNPFLDNLATAWEEEGLFARDLQGQLIRVEAATERDYTTMIEVEIDGQRISIPKAVPKTDSQGNILLDGEGRTIPRRTTIYDAAYRLFGEDLKTKQIIPTLCHLEHLHPVGVCRVCSVEVAKREESPKGSGKFVERAGEKLLPACVQPVERGMVVHTRMSPTNDRARERVNTSIKVLLELLASDHLPHDNRPVKQTPSDFERLFLAFADGNCGTRELNAGRFRLGGGEPPRRKDDSSHFIAVDHGACILCDRCSRGCNDIKHNFVIGRTGKGYEARIGFDLNDPMGTSSCVECGECMLSCPTNALTFRRPIESDWYREELKKPGRSVIPLEELVADPLLGTMPRRWLEWNATSVLKWEVKPGDTICNIGEYGATAFIIKSGRYDVLGPVRDPEPATPKNRNWFSKLLGIGGKESSQELRKVAELSADDCIFGEMSCLSSYPRNATVRATEPGVIYIIRRNALYTLQRNPRSRELLSQLYLTRAVNDHVRRRQVQFFEGLTAEEQDRCAKILREEARLVTLDPGQPVFRQGEEPDAFYMVRIGHVKLTETYAGSERVLTYLGPNKLFGEVAFVLQLPEFADDKTIPEQLRGRRTASAIALDDVELVRVSPETFRRLLDEFPVLRNRFIANARQVVGWDKQRRHDIQNAAMSSFVEQGLFNAQRLLVIDLESCTRCDECTRACSDTHQGITRFIRDGVRFDNFLVASSCRSCTDPYCLVGCPVDAIHRDGERLEIRIESHCIGCGLCANNCPYGNINMVGKEEKSTGVLAALTGSKAVVRHKATTCDLCTNVVGPGETVSCVYACPHHAAFRMDGQELLQTVTARGASTV